MYGVYLCGCTDCFLNAMFMKYEDAEAWGKKYGTNLEGYVIQFFKTPLDIPFDDTGWYIQATSQ